MGSKHSLLMRFDQFMSYYKGTNFIEKVYKNCGSKISSRPFCVCKKIKHKFYWKNVKQTSKNVADTTFKFAKKTSMANSVECLEYIKCYSLSSPRPVKNPSNSIRHTVRRYAVDLEDLKPYWKSEKEATFL